MSVFDSINNTTDKATDLGEKYVKTSHQYAKLKVFQQITFSLSLFVKTVAIGSLIFLAFIFFAVSGAIAIGNALESFTLGCLIIALIFCALALLVYFFRGILERKVIKVISLKFFDS